jgi:hypothetical protein
MKATYRTARALVVLLMAVAATGCAHQVSFQDAKYETSAKQQAASVVAVIDQATLENKVEVRSFMTGIAHSWEAQPGDMLKQVADIELPQMFANYEFSNTAKEPRGTGPGLVLGFAVPSYTFADFHADVSVAVVAKARGGNVLFEKTYSAQGDTQGGKMFWGGAFAMKSAIRQSSLDAYKKIFAQLRTDLEADGVVSALNTR